MTSLSLLLLLLILCHEKIILTRFSVSEVYLRVNLMILEEFKLKCTCAFESKCLQRQTMKNGCGIFLANMAKITQFSLFSYQCSIPP